MNTGPLWDEADRFAANQQAHCLIAPHHAARLLGVSRQRVHQLTQTGRLKRYTFFGDVFVSLRQIKHLERPPSAPEGP